MNNENILEGQEIQIHTGATSKDLELQSPDKEIMMQTKYVAARFVPIPRDLAKISGELQKIAKIAKHDWFYEFKVWSVREKRYIFIRGGTIGLAKTIIQMYGNCTILEDLVPWEQGIVLKNTLVDFEKGFTLERCEVIKSETPPGKWDKERWNRMVTNKHRSFNLRGLIQSYVPGFIWNSCVQGAREAALLEAETEISSKDALTRTFNYFKKNGISEQRLREFLDIGQNDPISGIHLVTLKNLRYQIEDGHVKQEDVKKITPETKDEEITPQKNSQDQTKRDKIKKIYEKMEMDGIKEKTVLDAYEKSSIGLLSSVDIDMILQDWQTFSEHMLNFQITSEKSNSEKEI